MELIDTVEWMNSADYKMRFVAEFHQTYIRYSKLRDMLELYDLGMLDFTPACPIELLRQQRDCMCNYLRALNHRARIENINLFVNVSLPSEQEVIKQ